MDSIITTFRQRSLQIDFLEMSLVQNKKDNGAISYKGKGYIRQTADDVLTFKLYASDTLNNDLFADLNSLNRIKPGELYGDTAYYTLTATASDGSTWTAERILPECSWLSGNKNPIAHGKLRSCARGERPKEPRAVSLHFFEKADIPCIIDEISFTAAGCEFNIHKNDESFIVRAKSESTLPAHFDTRIEEALRFLLAQSVTCRVLVQGGWLELISCTPRSRRTALGPPIARGSHSFLDQSWQLFGMYLGYVIREEPESFAI